MSVKLKIFIIHFQPLKLFPPAMNMIDFFSKEKEIELLVCTNRRKNSDALMEYRNDEAKIFRPATLSGKGIRQYFNYLIFYTSSFLLLLWHRPTTVLYIESLSSWPAIMYKKLRGKRVQLMVHYHEYTEPRLYEDGMFLSKWMHKMERKNYVNYSWISHTNEVRLQMFKSDCGLNNMDIDVFHVMPNYPSKSWDNEKIKEFPQQKIIRLVFVGSLGYKNMYLQEVIDWLRAHEEEFSLDIYSYNIDSEAKELIKSCELPNIKYFGGCNYKDLPGILNTYDIGLVIYKPFSQNTIHAVSNKVFEYLACGLDVWFSEDMTYTFKYIKDSSFPKILSVDFKSLNKLDYKTAISREGMCYKPSEYYYESIYPEMLDHILKQEGVILV